MTFSKSTQKGLLKNVQDGTSRPLEAREIDKQKGSFFLLTLFTWILLIFHLDLVALFEQSKGLTPFLIKFN